MKWGYVLRSRQLDKLSNFLRRHHMVVHFDRIEYQLPTARIFADRVEQCAGHIWQFNVPSSNTKMKAGFVNYNTRHYIDNGGASVSCVNFTGLRRRRKHPLLVWR